MRTIVKNHSILDMVTTNKINNGPYNVIAFKGVSTSDIYKLVRHKTGEWSFITIFATYIPERLGTHTTAREAIEAIRNANTIYLFNNIHEFLTWAAEVYEET